MQRVLICTSFVCALLVSMSDSVAQTRRYDMYRYYSERLDAAKQHCGSDTVLWINTKTGAISQPGAPDYGTTESGRYVCEHDQSQGSYGNEAEPTPLTPPTPPK